MARHCARCGHLADEYDRFCAACGAELAPLTDDGADAAPQTGVLGLRAATEGDSSPMPAVDPSTVGGLPAGAAVLVVLRGPQEGARFDLDPALLTVTVGRSPDCALFLDDVTVSRHHADLFAVDGHWELVDTGSLNGSYVNRRRIDRQVLVGGDELQIGKYRFVFLEAAQGDPS
ncbi:MAG TPA: FHA domain-containing protein [Candidatus Nanopelagicales bacterium]|nr:FHA domain-containing protein [Candidatus Nanopelagicales bacterium]